MSDPFSTPLTFLFTDIEGSTRLWEQHPDAMRPALARHDALLRVAIARNGGTLFKTLGDTFCVVFPEATQGVAAALEAQRALCAEDWGGDLALRVRMALHSGQAEERAGDYFGTTVNRVARILAAAHGGQVLLSAAVEARAAECLPADAALRDMGLHRLKDLQQPEQIFQLQHPGLPADFPPLRSLQTFAHNLPIQLTSFVGRASEMEEVHRLLTTTRLLTLTGAGGSGKTRLALQVAADLLDAYPDGVWLVELGPLSDPERIPQAIAAALGVKEERTRPLMETLLASLRARSLLLLLDNCEHLLSACSELATTLLRECPQVRLLATSREGLGIADEATYRVPSLSLPEARHLPSTEDLGRYEAVRLFLDRALVASPGFRVTPQNTMAVAQVCQRLDGIPLAIELAAARVKALPVEQIASRLDDRFRLLTGGSRAALPRQQTLRALIDWSYDLLDTEERALLRRLSVFRGGWTLEAAEAVGLGRGAIASLLESLAAKSLVTVEEREGQARYRLLETVRQYGRDRLVESGEAEEARSRHRDYFLHLAVTARPQLYKTEQVRWLAQLETEHDNLRGALEWCEDEADGAEAGVRLADALGRFWQVRGHLEEGRGWLERSLNRDGDIPTELRARALGSLGLLIDGQGRLAEARAVQEECLALWRSLNHAEGIANTLNNLGNIADGLADYATAQALYEESRRRHEERGDRQGAAITLGNLGNIARNQGHHAEALAFYEEALALRRESGEKRSIANILNNMANLADEQGNQALALIYHEEGLALRRELGDRWGTALALGNMGNVLFHQGDYARAEQLQSEALAIQRELGDVQSVALSLVNLGPTAAKRGEYAAARAYLRECLQILQREGDKRLMAYALEAVAELPDLPLEQTARLFGAAEALREAIGSPLPPNLRQEQERILMEFRTALGAEAFATAWEAGRALTREEAVAEALTAAQPSSETGA